MFFEKGFSLFNSFGGYGGYNGFGGWGIYKLIEGCDIEVYDIHQRVYLTFQESCLGIKKTFTFSRFEECNKCYGSGASREIYVDTCSSCQGAGFIRQLHCFGHLNVVMPCLACDGLGKQISRKHKCSVCNGIGGNKRTVSYDVNIPAGIANNQTLNIAGEGNYAIGDSSGISGAFLIFVEVAPHPQFIRDGFDLYLKLSISSTQAELGDCIKIPAIDGVIDFTIPPNTQDGANHVLHGKGIKRLKQEGSGDLIIEILVKPLDHTDTIQTIDINGNDVCEKSKAFLKL